MDEYYLCYAQLEQDVLTTTRCDDEEPDTLFVTPNYRYYCCSLGTLFDDEAVLIEQEMIQYAIREELVRCREELDDFFEGMATFITSWI